MALTSTEEALVRQLLDQQAAILSLAGNEATITSKLGATKVTLADLDAASSLADADLLLTRQGTSDKSLTAALLVQYCSEEFLAGITTPAQFDNSVKPATTEFVQRALGNSRGTITYGANQILSSSVVGSWVAPTSPGLTFTLPLASSVPSGAVLHFYANSQGLTLARQGTDTIVLGTNGIVSGVALGASDKLSLISVTSGWYALGGDATLPYSSLFGSSLAASGYQKLPSGLIIQWGSGGYASGSTVAFPQAFPNACFSVVVSHGPSATGPTTNGIGTKTNANFVVFVGFTAALWIAIGH